LSGRFFVVNVAERLRSATVGRDWERGNSARPGDSSEALA